MISKPKRILSVFSLVMINVIAIDSLRTLPLSAEYGFSLVFFYLIGALVFFIPTALVAAELATGWPKTGGVYVWVREAFGLKAGFLTIWLQWIYNVVWYPTILAFMAATLAYLINPALVDNKTFILISIILMFWTVTLLNCFGMEVSSWFSTVGALLGTMLPMLLIAVLGATWLYAGHPSQIAFHLHDFWPHFNLHNIDGLAFLSAVLFGLIGMEMSAVHAEEVDNPQRDYPRALLYSTFIIIFSLIAASLAIAIVLPQNEISLVGGLIQAFGVFFNTFHMHWMIPFIAGLIILGGLSGVSAWVIGPTKGLLIAARDGCLPPIYSTVNKKGVPVVILLSQAVVFTVLACLFLLMPTVNSSFWILSAMTAQLALLVYLFMFTAVIYLRYKFPDKPRAFKIPGGKVGVCIVAITGILTCLFAIALGFLPPSQINVGSVWHYEFILISGIVILCLPPFIFYAYRKTPQKN